MADLRALIRLRQHTVDEKQKVLGELYRQAEALEARRTHFREQIKKERQVLSDNPIVEMLAYFGLFQKAAERDIQRIGGQLMKLETRIRIAQDDMRAAFTELKRIEIVQQNRDAEDAAAQQRKETKELDDIGIEGFRRKET
jgi:flagellar FliJ protein